MVTTETHQSQDLLALPEDQDLDMDLDQDQDPGQQARDPELEQAAALFRFDVEKMGQGPANAITVLTLLDKLVKMLDTVQENQHKMEVHQMEMEEVVKGIQSDMSKLSRNHTHTSNTVSKLMDKSRKLSVTMKEVRSRMEQQGVQVKKLEANHAHLINRNNFKVLIFQEETEIPSSVFVKEPPPFPRDVIAEETEESVAGVAEGSQSQEAGMTTIDLSSDEDVGLDAELQEEEEPWPHDLESMESSRAKKLKQSSLKKVDSLKKAFSRQNIEKKMTKIGTKIVSAEQREKIKQKTSSLKVSPLSFSIRKPRSSSDSQPPEDLAQTQVQVQASSDQEVPFTEVHAQLAPGEAGQEEQVLAEEHEEEKVEIQAEIQAERQEEVLAEELEEVHGEKQEEEDAEEASELEMNLTLQSEGVSEALALSSTLPLDQREQDQ